MAAPARRPATYEDVLAAPEHTLAEVVDGELHLNPRPASLHVTATTALGGELGPPFKRGRGGPGGWLLLDEPELHLGADILVPDLAGWRRERMAVTGDVPYFTLAPDWICEALSPSTAKLDRTKKVPVYAPREGRTRLAGRREAPDARGALPRGRALARPGGVERRREGAGRAVRGV